MRLEGQGLLVLVDPVRTDGAAAARIGRAAKAAGGRGFLIGASVDGAAQKHEGGPAVRGSAPRVPVALFPGSAMQLTDQVDLVLFLSLVSGRNPQYLIEEHVRAVPFLRQHPVPTLSTAYILIDGGRVTSVESVSQTRPLPADKPELAAAHATAASLIGMQAIYLDAGSGAERPVSVEVIRACRAAVPQQPLFVGGGIRTPGQARAARQAGADFVVIGTVLEEEPRDDAGLEAFVEAVRGRGAATRSGRRSPVWPHSPAASPRSKRRKLRRSPSGTRRRCAEAAHSSLPAMVGAPPMRSISPPSMSFVITPPGRRCARSP